MEVYHEVATGTVTFNPYLPAIGRVLEVLRGYGPAGTTIELTNRDLSTAAACSAGSLPGILRSLEARGHIERVTSPRGSLIVVRSDQRSDQHADRSFNPSGCDQSHDRFFGAINATDAIETPDRSESADQDSDPPHTPHMVHDLSSSRSTAADQRFTIGGVWGGDALIADFGDQDADQESDPLSAAALVLAELGADPVTLAKIYAAQPDLTPGDILPQWEIAQAQERDGDARNARRLLFGTLMKPNGRVYGRATAAQVDWAAYAADPQFQPTSDPIRERAERLMPPMTALNNRTWTADLQFVMAEMMAGASDDQVRDALAVRQRRRSRPSGLDGGAP